MKRNKIKMKELLEILVILITLWQSISAGPTTISSDRLISYQINGKKSLHSLSDMFLSFTVEPNTLKHVMSCNLTNVTTTMAQSLAPSYIRLAGPHSNELLFETSPEYKTTNDKFLVTGPEWLQVNEYFSKIGMRVIAGLANGMENKPNELDISNTLEMISFSDKNNISVDWQLGYELQQFSKTRGKEMGQDLASLKKVLQVFPRYRSSSLIGPDMTGYDKREDILFLRSFMFEAGSSLDVFTWHPFSDDELEDGNPMEILSNGLSSLDNWLWMKDGQKSNFKGVTSRKPIWIAESETKPRASNLSQTTTWVKRLGAAAQLGISVYLRKPHLMTIYEPTSEYWFAILYKSLVSKHVLDISLSENLNSMVQTFGHCTQILENPEESIINPNIVYQRGSVTVYGVNTSPEPARLRFKLNSKTDETAHLYILTEDNNEPFPRTLLNKQLLSLSPENELPILSPKIRLSPKYLFLPPRSIFFIVFPEAKSQACLHQNGKTKIKRPQEEIFNTETFTDNILEIIEDKDDPNEKYVNYRSQINKSPSLPQTTNENVNTKFVTYSDGTWISSFPEKLKEVLNQDHESKSRKKDKSKSEMYKILAQAILGKRNVSSERDFETHESHWSVPKNSLKVSSRRKRMPATTHQSHNENEKSPGSEIYVMPLNTESIPESARSVPVVHFMTLKHFAKKAKSNSESPKEIQQLSTSHTRDSKIHKRSAENESSTTAGVAKGPDNMKSSKEAANFIPDLSATFEARPMNSEILGIDTTGSSKSSTTDGKTDNTESSETKKIFIPDLSAIEGLSGRVNSGSLDETSNFENTERTDKDLSILQMNRVVRSMKLKNDFAENESTTIAAIDNSTDNIESFEEARSFINDLYVAENYIASGGSDGVGTTENFSWTIDSSTENTERTGEARSFTTDLYVTENYSDLVDPGSIGTTENVSWTTYSSIDNTERTDKPKNSSDFNANLIRPESSDNRTDLSAVQINRPIRSMGLKNESLKNSAEANNLKNSEKLNKTESVDDSELNKTSIDNTRQSIKANEIKNSTNSDKIEIDSFSDTDDFDETAIFDDLENLDETEKTSGKSADTSSKTLNISNSSANTKQLSVPERSSEFKLSNQTTISIELKSSTTESSNTEDNIKPKEFVKSNSANTINSNDSEKEDEKTPNSSTLSKIAYPAGHPIIFKTTKIIKEIIYPEIANDISTYLKEITEDFEQDLSKRRKREGNDTPVETPLTKSINEAPNLLSSRSATPSLKKSHNKNLNHLSTHDGSSHIKKLDQKSIASHTPEITTSTIQPPTTSTDLINKHPISHKKATRKHTSVHVDTQHEKSQKHTHRSKREAVEDIKNFFGNVGSETEKQFKTFVHWFGKRTEELGRTMERVKRRIADVFVESELSVPNESKLILKEAPFSNITEELFHNKLTELSTKLDSLLKSINKTEIGEKHNLLFDLEKMLEEAIKIYENLNKTSGKNQSSTASDELMQETQKSDDQNQSSTPQDEPRQEMTTSKEESENQNEILADNNRQKRETLEIAEMHEKIKQKIQDVLNNIDKNKNGPIGKEIVPKFEHSVKDHIPELETPQKHKQPINAIPLHQNSPKSKSQLLEDLKIKIEAYKQAIREKVQKHLSEMKSHLHKRDVQNSINIGSDLIRNANSELKIIIDDSKSVPAPIQDDEDEKPIRLGDMNTMPNAVKPTPQDYEEQKKELKEIFKHISFSQYEKLLANQNRGKRDETLQKVKHNIHSPPLPTRTNTLKPDNKLQDLKSKIQERIQNLKNKAQELEEKRQKLKNERNSPRARQHDPENESKNHEPQPPIESHVHKRDTSDETNNELISDYLIHNKIETMNNRQKRDTTSNLHKPRHEKLHQSPSTPKLTPKSNNQLLQDLKSKIQARVENLQKKARELKNKNSKPKIEKKTPRARENPENESQANETQFEIKSHSQKQDKSNELNLVRKKRYSTLDQLTKKAHQSHEENSGRSPSKHQNRSKPDQRLQDLKAKIQERIENLRKKDKELKNKRQKLKVEKNSNAREVDPENESQSDETEAEIESHLQKRDTSDENQNNVGWNTNQDAMTKNRKKRESKQDVHKPHHEKSKSPQSPPHPFKPDKKLEDFKAKIQAYIQNLRDKAQELKTKSHKPKIEKHSSPAREVEPENELQDHQTQPESKSHLHKREMLDDLKHGFKTAASKTEEKFKSFSDWLFGDNHDQKKDNERSKRTILNLHDHAARPNLKSSNGTEVVYQKDDMFLAKDILELPFDKIFNPMTLFLEMIFSSKIINREDILAGFTKILNATNYQKITPAEEILQHGESSGNLKNADRPTLENIDQPTTMKEDEIPNEIRRKRATVLESSKKDIHPSPASRQIKAKIQARKDARKEKTHHNFKPRNFDSENEDKSSELRRSKRLIEDNFIFTDYNDNYDNYDAHYKSDIHEIILTKSPISPLKVTKTSESVQSTTSRVEVERTELSKGTQTVDSNIKSKAFKIFSKVKSECRLENYNVPKYLWCLIEKLFQYAM